MYGVGGKGKREKRGYIAVFRDPGRSNLPYRSYPLVFRFKQRMLSGSQRLYEAFFYGKLFLIYTASKFCETLMDKNIAYTLKGVSSWEYVIELFCHWNCMYYYDIYLNLHDYSKLCD